MLVTLNPSWSSSSRPRPRPASATRSTSLAQLTMPPATLFRWRPRRSCDGISLDDPLCSIVSPMKNQGKIHHRMRRLQSSFLTSILDLGFDGELLCVHNVRPRSVSTDPPHLKDLPFDQVSCSFYWSQFRESRANALRFDDEYHHKKNNRGGRTMSYQKKSRCNTNRWMTHFGVMCRKQ